MGWKMGQPSKYGCHSLLKATKAELLLLKLIHLFARDLLVMKMLEIVETKTT